MLVATPPQKRLRRNRFYLVLLVAALLPSLTGCQETAAPDRAAVINLVNQSRRSAGLHSLSEDPTLDIKADGWARKLRDECRLQHSRLSDGAPSQWQKLGENVGYGGSIEIVHDAYLKSPSHKANIMDGAFNRIGAGSVWGTCDGQRRVFTVQVFMKG